MDRKHIPFQCFEDPIRLNHSYLSKFIQPGDWVIDATCGNGKDTLMLAELVGAEGCVFAYDIQSVAITLTKNLISEQQVKSTVKYYCESHERFHKVEAELMKEPSCSIKSVVYNLGYLPGSDHEVTTEFESTIRSMQSGLQLLSHQGVLSVMCYLGHDQGKEYKKVRTFLSELDPKVFVVVETQFLNRKNSPVLILVEKRDLKKV